MIRWPSQNPPTNSISALPGKSMPVPKRAAWVGSLWTLVPVPIKMEVLGILIVTGTDQAAVPTANRVVLPEFDD
jgi:hypothetical protein